MGRGVDRSVTVTALLDAGADPYAKDAKGFTALRLAKKRGHTEAMAILSAAMGQ